MEGRMSKHKRPQVQESSVARTSARLTPRRPAAPGMSPRQILVHLKRMLVFLADYIAHMEDDFPGDGDDKMTR